MTKTDGSKRLPVVDSEAAAYVRRMFEMRASGISPNHIAQTYNNEGILPPGDYKEQKLGIPNTRKSHHLWSSSTVKQVLTNPIYLGHMVQLKTTNVSYKNKKQIKRDPEDMVGHGTDHQRGRGKSVPAYIQAKIPVYAAKRLYTLRGQRQQNASVFLADVRCASPAAGDDQSPRTVCRPERAVCGAKKQTADTDRRTVAGGSEKVTRVHSKMLEQTSRCLAEQAGGRADRLDGGNAQPPCGKRQHLRCGDWWKGAHQQTKSDRIPCHAGCRAESYDSTDEKTTCWLQAGRKAIKSKGMVSKCA